MLITPNKKVTRSDRANKTCSYKGKATPESNHEERWKIRRAVSPTLTRSGSISFFFWLGLIIKTLYFFWVGFYIITSKPSFNYIPTSAWSIIIFRSLGRLKPERKYAWMPHILATILVNRRSTFCVITKKKFTNVNLCVLYRLFLDDRRI